MQRLVVVVQLLCVLLGCLQGFLLSTFTSGHLGAVISFSEMGGIESLSTDKGPLLLAILQLDEIQKFTRVQLTNELQLANGLGAAFT